MQYYKPVIKEFTLAEKNEKNGLFQFIMELADGSKCRIFYSKNPDWKATHIARLNVTPCPVCKKDFICNCMEKFLDVLDQQIKDRELFQAALAK